MKENIYIFAGGQSSRFGGNPKILETYNYNKEVLKIFFNVYIVTSKEIFPKISHLDADFIIQEMGNGSGQDVFNLLTKLKSPAFVAWSDVFYSEDNIIDIIRCSENKENCMTVTQRKNPYISIVADDGKIVQYKKEQKIGVQDNSLFYIHNLKEASEEFMDMAIKNDFHTYMAETKSEYFNTKEELQELKLSKNLV